jgi:hypothetical protein
MKDIFKKIDVLGLASYDFTEEEILFWFENVKKDGDAKYLFSEDDIKNIHRQLRKIKIENINKQL